MYDIWNMIQSTDAVKITTRGVDMTKRIIIYGLLFVLIISLGVLSISCTTNANADNDPKPADVSLDNYYTKDEIDTMLSEYYLKGVIDTLFYQNTEVDTLVSNKESAFFTARCQVSQLQTLYAINNRMTDSENERTVSFAIPADGVLKNLFVFCGTPLLGTGNVVVTVRLNGADTLLTLPYSYTDGIIVKSNTSNIVNVNQGDLISFEFEETANVNTTSVWIQAIVLFDTSL